MTANLARHFNPGRSSSNAKRIIILFVLAAQALCFVLFVFAACAAQASVATPPTDSTPTSAPALAYPSARRGDVVDDYHGVKVADPYRWLEQLDSTETRAWVAAEAQLTDEYLEKIPARQEIKKRLTDLLNFERFGLPFHKGDRYF